MLVTLKHVQSLHIFRPQFAGPLVHGVSDPEHLRLLAFLGELLSLLRSFRGPRRRQILGPPQGGRSYPNVPRSLWGVHNPSAGSANRDFGALWELLGALLTSSPRSRRLQTYIFQNSQDVSAENLTFAQNSQDVSAGNLISEVRKTKILQLLTNVSTEIAVFLFEIRWRSY